MDKKSIIKEENITTGDNTQRSRRIKTTRNKMNSILIKKEKEENKKNKDKMDEDDD